MSSVVEVKDEGYAFIRMSGIPDIEELKKTVDHVLAANQALSTKFRSIKYLVDVKEVEEIPHENFLFGLKGFKNVDFDKCAFLGLDDKQKAMLDLMVTLTGKGSKMRYFEHKADAVDWLNSSQNAHQ